jgi:hypothetical protein
LRSTVGKGAYAGKQISKGVNFVTQAINIRSGNVSDNWNTTSKWNKAINSINGNWKISTSTRYDNLNIIFN